MARMVTYAPRVKHTPVAVGQTSSKDRVIQKMSAVGFRTFGGGLATNSKQPRTYDGWANPANNFLYLYTAEKIRAKYKDVGNKQRVLVRAGGWTYRIYRFNLDDVLFAAQKARTFEVILK